MMGGKASNLLNVGRLSGVFGVKGWVKVKSSTEPPENLLQYSPWWLKTRYGVKEVEVDEALPHGDGFVVHINGVDDRNDAMAFVPCDVAVELAQLPSLSRGEYYWCQLQGLQVVSSYAGGVFDLGVVDRLVETGANDVLVVKPTETSLDERERWLPYVPEQFVRSIDLEAGQLLVEWDPEF